MKLFKHKKEGDRVKYKTLTGTIVKEGAKPTMLTDDGYLISDYEHKFKIVGKSNKQKLVELLSQISTYWP